MQGKALKAPRAYYFICAACFVICFLAVLKLQVLKVCLAIPISKPGAYLIHQADSWGLVPAVALPHL